MRILELRSENFKRLTAVTIRPDGSLVQITGKNGAGKTSLLDSIYVALAGKSAAPKQPIRKGQQKATIKLDLGELIVTREFRAEKDGDGYTTSLIVESKDGAQFRSPQKMLDELLGALSFDPLGFARADAKSQVDMVRALVPGFDFAKADAENAGDYEKRRDVNRTAKELKAQADAIDVDEGLEAIDESALVDELEKAGKQNADIETRKANRQRLESDAEALDKEAESHDKHAADLMERARVAKENGEQARAEAKGIRDKLTSADPLPDPVETAPIREKIAAARAQNSKVADARRKAELVKKIDGLEKASQAYTDAIALRTEAKAMAIAAANLPVPGLAFGAEGVTLNGVPFDQGSDAEQLRASVAIAAALNPKLRVIRIRDGSLLDEDGMKILAELADAQDMQVWIERVDSSGKVGFVIADGHLVEKEDEAAA